MTRLSPLDLAARLAHDVPMTLDRAARIYRVPVELVRMVWERRYPNQERRDVP